MDASATRSPARDEQFGDRRAPFVRPGETDPVADGESPSMFITATTIAGVAPRDFDTPHCGGLPV
jgi:hypothetical protein